MVGGDAEGRGGVAAVGASGAAGARMVRAAAAAGWTRGVYEGGVGGWGEGCAGQACSLTGLPWPWRPP